MLRRIEPRAKQVLVGRPVSATLAPMAARVVIYTDGGAVPNPGAGGWAAVLLHSVAGESREISGGALDTTNNRMELMAAIEALEALNDSCDVEIFTDSTYVRRGISEWLPGWQAAGWRRRDGEPVKNADLWRRLAAASFRHEIDWRWVKGHSGHEHNERADTLATAEIAKIRGEAATFVEVDELETDVDVEVLLKVTCRKGWGGWAARLREKAAEEVLGGGMSGVTANQLELVAAAQILTAVPRDSSLLVRGGSDYLRKGASVWMSAWKTRGWRTKEGGEIKNTELWRRLDRLLAGREVHWRSASEEDTAELRELGRRIKERASQ